MNTTEGSVALRCPIYGPRRVEKTAIDLVGEQGSELIQLDFLFTGIGYRYIFDAETAKALSESLAEAVEALIIRSGHEGNFVPLCPGNEVPLGEVP